MLCEKSRATVFLCHRHPAARLTGDLSLGGLYGSAGARRLTRRAIMLLELAKGPPHSGPFPASTAYRTRRNAGIVERRFGLLPTFRAAPSHRSTLPTAKDPAPDCAPRPYLSSTRIIEAQPFAGV